MSNSKIIVKASQVVKTDKNGIQYAVIKFAERSVTKTPFGELPTPVAQCKSGTKVCWETSYIENKLEEELFKSPLFNEKDPAKGGWFLGAVVTAKVPTYYIDENEVDTYTCVVFGDTTDIISFEKETKRTFLAAGHNLDYVSVQKELVKDEVVEDEVESVITDDAMEII